MPVEPIDVEELLQPLPEGAPCGPELDFDPDFQALERAGQGKPEVQYGDKVFPAEPPEWPRVHELASGLARRTRDLRLAVWLTRSGARLHGLDGALRGLQLCHGLLVRYWADVHPHLDASDHDDPTMRMNALTPLAAPDFVLADLRAAGLSATRGSLTLRELELGLGQDAPHGGEALPTEAGVLQGLAALLQSQPGLSQTLRAALEAAQGIASVVEDHVKGAAPDLSRLVRLLSVGPAALARTPAGAAGPAAAADGTAPAAGVAGAPAAGGTLQSRGDAVRELDRICEWLERNEPSHPAPLLLRRAQRLMNMTFIEIIQDLAPGGIEQVQNIAGPRPE